MANTLEYIHPRHRGRQLRLIRLWAARAPDFDPIFTNTLLRRLREAHDLDTVRKILGIFRAIATNHNEATGAGVGGSARSLSGDRELAAIDAYFREVTSACLSASGLFLVLACCFLFPCSFCLRLFWRAKLGVSRRR